MLLDAAATLPPLPPVAPGAPTAVVLGVPALGLTIYLVALVAPAIKAWAAAQAAATEGHHEEPRDPAGQGAHRFDPCTDCVAAKQEAAAARVEAAAARAETTASRADTAAAKAEVTATRAELATFRAETAAALTKHHEALKQITTLQLADSKVLETLADDTREHGKSLTAIDKTVTLIDRDSFHREPTR